MNRDLDPPPPPVVRLLARRAVAGRSAGISSGLDHWIDGTFGTVERHGQVIALSPNGPDIAVHTMPSRPTQGNEQDRRRAWPFGSLTTARAQIIGLPDDVDHASGGPAIYDSPSDRIGLVYHGERHRSGEPRSYCSFLGLAVSADGGVSFVDRGPILTSMVSQEEWQRFGGCIEVGPGSFVTHGDQLQLYFQDKSPLGHINLAMASMALDNAMDAIRHDRSWTLRKHAAPEPLEGGPRTPSSDIYPATTPRWRIEWFDVATLREDGRHLLFFSSRDRGWWFVHAATSWDGIHWSDPTPVLDAWSRMELLYLTVWSGDAALQRTVTGGELDLICVRSATGGFDRWNDAHLEVMTVSIH